jgi:uncharacterized protein YndB with AHSA1/START domain
MNRLCQLILFVAVMVIFFLSDLATADVISSGPDGFIVNTSVLVKANPGKVYGTVVSEVEKWWDPAHTFSGDSENLSIEAEPGGCFCERWGAGSAVQHLEVVYVDPGKMLRMTGGLGPLQSLAVFGSMTWTFTETNDGTKLDVTYRVTGYSRQGLAQWADPVDEVLAQQISRLKYYLETGKAAGH